MECIFSLGTYVLILTGIGMVVGVFLTLLMQTILALEGRGKWA